MEEEVLKVSELICGSVKAKDTGELAQSLKHFSKTISLLSSHLNRRRYNRKAMDRLIAPFAVRSLVEVACTGLIARIDPFRVLTLAKIQSQGEYDPSEKIASAMQWRGDVLSDGKQKTLWDTSHNSRDMTRALLGDYQDEVFWQPAFLRLIDFLSNNEYSSRASWLADLINTDPTSLVPRLRGTATKLYSSASKGVHHEFVLSISSYYDDATLDELSENAIRLICTMALILNFSESIPYPLTPKRAVSNYEAIQP